MAPQVEISIPNTTISTATKPYTIYNITLRLPLRSYTVQKRYSDFLNLHSGLTEQVGAVPPAQLPAKSWFSRTVNSPELTEDRRVSLENYLQTINTNSDSRWRNTSVWRAFLNLPSSFTNQSTAKPNASSNLHSILSGPGGGGAPITDPIVWLDCHRDLKTQLHAARLNLTNRDQASTPQKQHEASAAAKSSLVKAGSMISALEQGLENIQKVATEGWGGQKLGDGEIRRRKDLIASARKDKEGLEDLVSAMATKSRLDNAVATMQDKTTLVATRKPGTGRVLGRETGETRELGNQGVLQLQQQKMKDQDQDVDEIRKIVQRQRELGERINEELEVQNDILRMVDEDVDRVKSKIDIAKKRVSKIK